MNMKYDDSSDDFMVELDGLKQTASVKDYYVEFEKVTSKMQLSCDYRLYCFIAGLEEEIRCNVNMFYPQTIHEAYYMALIHELTLRAMETKIANKVFDEMPRLDVMGERGNNGGNA